MEEAISALTPLGFPKKLICDAIRELIKMYGDDEAGWYVVEENNYKLVIDKIIEDRDRKKEEADVKKEELNLEAPSGFKKRSCYGWISDDEDIVAGVELSQIIPSSEPKRRPCYEWISDDEDIISCVEPTESNPSSVPKR